MTEYNIGYQQTYRLNNSIRLRDLYLTPLSLWSQLGDEKKKKKKKEVRKFYLLNLQDLDWLF